MDGPEEKRVTRIGDLDEGVESRLAPLLAVLELSSEQALTRTDVTAVVVGHTHVYVDLDGHVCLQVVVGQISTGPQRGVGAQSGLWRSAGTADARLLDSVLDGLCLQWARNDHALPMSPQARATTAAKALAENSRNAVALLREARYEVERRLGYT